MQSPNWENGLARVLLGPRIQTWIKRKNSHWLKLRLKIPRLWLRFLKWVFFSITADTRNKVYQDNRGLLCAVDFSLVQWHGLPVEGTGATSPNPHHRRAVRKSVLILEQPHPGNTSEKMEHYEIKIVCLTGQSRCISVHMLLPIILEVISVAVAWSGSFTKNMECC